MSWSINLFGSPSKVAEALEANSDKLSGQSKAEFDAAKPHLIALVKETFLTDEGKKRGYSGGQLVRVEASGSGTALGEEQIQRSCKCVIEPFYGTFVP